MQRRAAFATLGCKVNQYETESMEGLFVERGYELVAFNEEADVYVINTCSVTQLGEKKSRQLIRRAHRMNPQAIVAVTGCYAQAEADKIREMEGVGVVIGTRERGRIVDLVEEAMASGQTQNAVGNIMEADVFEDIPLTERPLRTRAFLKIQEGCTNFCTYCIIPYTRGPLRSRPLGSIREEAQRLAESGFDEIVLTGIHLGAYGRDLTEDIDLADAAQAVLDAGNVKRLRIGSLESIEVSPKLLTLLKEDGRICHHLHLPLQAGHDTVLKAMNRHYTAAEFKDLLTHLLAEVPDLAISTDIIVGFPGETDEIFEATLDYVKSLPLARMHVFPYSRRKGTPAASYPNQVDEAVKKERAHRMGQLAEAKARAYAETWIGKDVEILVERCSGGRIEGLTPQYIRVYAEGEAEEGTFLTVCPQKTIEEGLWATVK
ncbi:MAG: tRNA (N(6)-L-threonylcarbamoyladenosine(37)-C(2))-methylthiotransferase MtaB [Selenomonadales bacterium]|nr:tRNA (N(6)-L-threonylcarbamoyladenosine(37)-C(2))-methylthiotransferase MtaB [Selenomonadales bacterium]